MTVLADYLTQRAAYDVTIAAESSAVRRHELRREASRLDATINRLQTRMTPMRVERYCSCGAALKVDVPRSKRQQTLIVFYDQHHGEGHEQTDAAGAEAARMGSSVGYGRESRKERRA